jgi:hypothetical protein
MTLKNILKKNKNYFQDYLFVHLEQSGQYLLQ